MHKNHDVYIDMASTPGADQLRTWQGRYLDELLARSAAGKGVGVFRRARRVG
jgi:hypothetical protein